ncbi:hypothetical protein CFter6_1852 [Collimonas fungivorans]|uniref:Uncharacterized protein n=1 Tax=Collimonas fungivorans TaxID=158899 RepID=A0A127P9P6_9BURK|nr:hypothetical protein CFter6_1852 [Collimonas fungivorans]
MSIIAFIANPYFYKKEYREFSIFTRKNYNSFPMISARALMVASFRFVPRFLLVSLRMSENANKSVNSCKIFHSSIFPLGN